MVEYYPDYVLGGIPGCFLAPGVLAVLGLVSWLVAIVVGALAACVLVGHALFRAPPTARAD